MRHYTRISNIERLRHRKPLWFAGCTCGWSYPPSHYRERAEAALLNHKSVVETARVGRIAGERSAVIQ